MVLQDFDLNTNNNVRKRVGAGLPARLLGDPAAKRDTPMRGYMIY